ncbi:MAG: HyaD/HybD family hydrogenase maturation endopeptidase [Veillonellaceae bacterium]|nr:HyaD/HybD family hydrogenase maturation endopeptidase [Veillonellaceae bacterium]
MSGITAYNSEPIVVLGVGNILLSDEGVGVHVVNKLRDTYSFTPNITLLDGGTMGMEIMSFMVGMRKLLLLDAISGEEKPGTVYQFHHQEMNKYFNNDEISMHEIGIQDVLAIRFAQDDPLDDAVVIGVEPEDLEFGLEPTQTVQAVMPDVEQRVLAVLRSWGVEAHKK